MAILCIWAMYTPSDPGMMLAVMQAIASVLGYLGFESWNCSWEEACRVSNPDGETDLHVYRELVYGNDEERIQRDVYAGLCESGGLSWEDGGGADVSQPDSCGDAEQPSRDQE